jgi:hypothetical protein
MHMGINNGSGEDSQSYVSESNQQNLKQKWYPLSIPVCNVFPKYDP